MARIRLGKDVLTAGYDRMYEIYKHNHKVVLSFSGGKDSTVALELCIMAARAHGKLPVNVVIQEEEISYPGTYEFVEQTAARPEVNMRWLVMCQPMVNIFNRAAPYWWVMDPLLDPEEWVRQPPAFAEWTPDRAIETMVSTERYGMPRVPQDYGRLWVWDQAEADADNATWGEGLLAPHYASPKLVNVIGLRVEESQKRALGLASSRGYMTREPTAVGAYGCRPIYDWKDGDVWLFIRDNKLAYNPAYDILYKMGIPKERLRIGPPTMTIMGIEALSIARRAWPRWFDRVCKRVQGIRTAAQFGRRACTAQRRLGETYEQCFKRECLGPSTPEWIRVRAERLMQIVLSGHAHHATSPYPEIKSCPGCGVINSWRKAVDIMWNGDPYGLYTIGTIGMVQPEFFRPGAGTWFGHVEQQYGRRVGMVEDAHG